jgi:pimeloyl-ACP methyl ester carboxylesterase
MFHKNNGVPGRERHFFVPTPEHPMSTTPLIRQRYLTIDGRRVRYLRAGSGSPVVLIYANSATLTAHIKRLSTKHTVFAFDNPGYCGSDPLDLAEITVADLADALAAAMHFMGFTKVPVFGTHTGAAIAIELAMRHPNLVSGLMLDGIPLFTREEFEAHERDGYFFRLEPQLLGGHFTNSWTRARDWLAFDPWCSRTPEHARLSGPEASAESLHFGMLMYFRYARHYEKPYKAAFKFGEIGASRIASIECPCVFAASVTDGLSAHFPRFPPLKANQRIVLLGADPDDMFALIERTLEDYDAQATPPSDPAPSGGGRGIEKQFVDLEDGQIFVRSRGNADRPAVLLLHDAPGSALVLEPLIAALGKDHRVYAPDLPGCAESDPLPVPQPTITDYVEAMRRVCAALQIDRVTVYGIGFGSSIAIELARAAPELVASLVLRGVLLPDSEERRDMEAYYAPHIAVDAYGGHWYRTWLMLRDSLIYWPWYKRGPQAMRAIRADFSADRLHDWTVQVMLRHRSYHHVIDAALLHDAGAALKRVAAPILVCDDAEQPFSAYKHALAACAPHAEIFPSSDPVWEAERIGGFIAGQCRES